MERNELIDEVKELIGASKDEYVLSWGTICHYTDFDSFATALSYGYNWKLDNPNDDMRTMPIRNLKMAAFNISNFLKDLPK